MPFSQNDFQNNEIRQELIVIINDAIGIKPLYPFSKLTTKQQREFNVKLHEYIAKLPEEGYLEVIHKDFCYIMSDVFETFKPENCFVRNINTEVIPISSSNIIVE